MLTRLLLPIATVAVATMIVPVPQDAKPATAQADRSTEQFVIDAGHSSVLFRVQHLNAAPFWGRFNRMKGSLRVDDANLDKSFIKIEVDASSVDSNSEGRDKHLKNQDFFSVKEYPKVTFESTKVEKKGDVYHVTGDFTMRGVKKSVVAKATHTGTAKMSDRFGLRTGYEAELVVKRSDFGMKYMTKGNAIGDEVKIVIAIEGKLP